MHAALGLKMPVGIFAGDQKRRGFNAHFFALLDVNHLRFKAAAFNPALIHAQQHVGPVAGLGSAGAGMDGHERVGAIVFAGKELA